MPKRQLFNANTQQLEDAELTVDDNNEIIATFSDDSFIKFPPSLTQDEFDTLIARHEEQNSGHSVITAESEEIAQAERDNSHALINAKTDNTMSNKGDKTNAPSTNNPTP